MEIEPNHSLELYYEALPTIESNLTKMEEGPNYIQDGTRTKSVEVALTFFKEGQKHTANKELFQYDWYKKKYGIEAYRKDEAAVWKNGKMAFDYSREKTLNLVQECFSALVQENNLSKKDITECTITVHTTNRSLFSRGRLLCYDNVSTTMTKTFSPVSSKEE